MVVLQVIWDIESLMLSDLDFCDIFSARCAIEQLGLARFRGGDEFMESFTGVQSNLKDGCQFGLTYHESGMIMWCTFILEL